MYQNTTSIIQCCSTFQLGQNYPNPFNSKTTIKYRLAEAVNVTITVYNLLGQQIETLVDTRQNAGRHKVLFEAHNLSSGMYIYNMKAGNWQQTRQMMLVE